MITNTFVFSLFSYVIQKSIQSILKKKLLLLKRFLLHWYQKVFTAFISKSIFKIFYKIAQRYCFYKNRSPKILEPEKFFLNHFIDEAHKDSPLSKIIMWLDPE